MKKIAIATYINDLNYGALLQAYSLGIYFKNHSFDVYYVNPSIGGKTIESIPDRLLKKLFYYIVAKKRITKKRTALNSFLNSNFSIISESDFEKDIDEFTALVCGSDQIWNIEITDGFNKVFFANYDVFSFAYSASVGNISIVKENEEQYRKKLKNFAFISTREQNLSEYINNEMGLNAIHTCDPVFLADNTLSMTPATCRLIKSKYIFVYTMNKNKNIIRIAREMSKKLKLPVIMLNNNLYSYSYNGFKTVYALTIEEFISMICNAEYVITNSFHGTSLSLIFEKQFFAVKNVDRNDRILDLLNNLELSDRFIESEKDVNFDMIDYCEVRKKKNTFVNQSKDYLNRCLEAMK